MHSVLVGLQLMIVLCGVGSEAARDVTRGMVVHSVTRVCAVVRAQAVWVGIVYVGSKWLCPPSWIVVRGLDPNRLFPLRILHTRVSLGSPREDRTALAPRPASDRGSVRPARGSGSGRRPDQFPRCEFTSMPFCDECTMFRNGASPGEHLCVTVEGWCEEAFGDWCPGDMQLCGRRPSPPPSPLPPLEPPLEPPPLPHAPPPLPIVPPNHPPFCPPPPPPPGIPLPPNWPRTVLVSLPPKEIEGSRNRSAASQRLFEALAQHHPYDDVVTAHSYRSAAAESAVGLALMLTVLQFVACIAGCTVCAVLQRFARYFRSGLRSCGHTCRVAIARVWLWGHHLVGTVGPRPKAASTVIRERARVRRGAPYKLARKDDNGPAESATELLCELPAGDSHTARMDDAVRELTTFGVHGQVC